MVTIQSINQSITVDALLTLAAVPRKGVGKSSTALFSIYDLRKDKVKVSDLYNWPARS